MVFPFYWNLWGMLALVGSCAWLYSAGWRRLGFWAMVAVFTAWMQWGMYTNIPLRRDDAWTLILILTPVLFCIGLRRGGAR
jgi:hypothetical protein